MDEGPPMFSALDDAFVRAEFPTLGCSNPTLGNEKWDVFIHHILNSAGITIEKLQAPAEADETTVPLHESVQIVVPLDMEAAMKNKEASKISFVKNKDMEGVQVKLNNAYRWKVTICEEVPERGAVGSGRTNRKRAATEYRKKVFHSPVPPIYLCG